MKEVVCIFEGGFVCNTYLVMNEHDAIIIDPANHVRNVEKELTNRCVLGILLTHAHYDHFCQINAYLKRFNCPIYLTKKAFMKLGNPETSCSKYFDDNIGTTLATDQVHYICENEPIKLNDDFIVQPLLTPGHTNCSVSYIIDDHLFTGDTVFKNGVGRTDLPTGNLFELTQSVRRLLELKIDYHIWPGHDDDSSVFVERKNNYFYLNLRSKG